jgi:uncharacterized damage-inducible protein DinB
MSVSVGVEQLLDYSDHERLKWRAWVAADPARLKIAVQPGGRFPTVGDLLDHIFLVERRHLCRLEGGTPPDSTGIPHGEWQRLFDYAGLVRSDLRRYAADADEELGSQTLTWRYMDQEYSMSRRRLMTHILLHEIRHFAQIALAARMTGVEPPGEHDLIYFAEFT